MSTVAAARAVPRAWGVWALTGCLALIAAVSLYALPATVPAAVQLRLPWWVLIPAFAFAFKFRMSFEFRDQSRGLSLDQVFLLAGLYFCTPVGLAGARVVAFALILVPRRQPLPKLAMNLSLAAAAAGVAQLAFRLFWQGGVVGYHSWPSAFAAALADYLVSYFGVAAAVGVSQHRWSWAEVAGPLAFDTLSMLVVTCIAVVGVTALAYDPVSGVMLVLGLGVTLVVFNGYNRTLTRQRALERLHAFARELGPVVADPTDLGPMLTELRRLVHADRLELALLDGPDEATVFAIGAEGPDLRVSARRPAELSDAARLALSSPQGSLLEKPRQRPWLGTNEGEDAMLARVGAPERPVGLLTAEHRSGPARRFDGSDLKLLEAMASQLGTALEKGRLLENLRRAATHDSLTGLANLDSLRAHLTEAAANSGPREGVVALFVDLDRFQDLNDTLGHDAGDDVLIEVAHRLSQAAPHGGLAARVGGDKFALVLPGSAGSEVARLAALAVKSRIEGPVALGGVTTDVRVTIGIARSPQHAGDGVTLLRRAEMAMGSAKGTTSGISEWQPDLERDGSRRLQVLAALRQALASGDIRVVYQPKLVLGSGEVSGAEALARWRHPELGVISPLEFIPLAETTGLIGTLTTHVLRSALTNCRSWHRAGVRIGVAVNLSARSLADPILVGQVAALLTAAELEPHWLTLEITEGSVMENPAASFEVLNQLRQLGVRLAIDDFGTGYSSLTYVRGLPVDEVKIDKGFIDHLADDRADQAVVRAIVELAHSLNLTTVAEGVESTAQALVLERLDVDEVQGFFYARPMVEKDFAEWLAPRMVVQE